MSNFKFAAGVVLAGALAFGGVFAAQAITAPMLHGTPATADHGAQSPKIDPDLEEDESLTTLLEGRWKAPKPANQEAYVVFTDDGQWEASDGCNSSQGTWSVEPDGAFEGTGGAMTQIGCDNVAIPTAVATAITAEITPTDHLILTDDNGAVMLLVRTSNITED